MIQPKLKKKYLRKAHHLIRRSTKSQRLQANVEPFLHHHHRSVPVLERSNSDPTQAFFTPAKEHLKRRNYHVNSELLHSRQGGVYPLCEVTPVSSHAVKQYRPPLSMRDASLRSPLTSTPVGRTPVARRPHSDLATQLKVQIEVNRELKRLLVAAVGNDLQQRFEQIVQEKTSLSRGLDASLKQLADNNEEFDRVSIECDIWRSKYLASRVMIDELASWKAELSLQLKESQKALQSLLAERRELGDELLKCSTHLCRILERVQVSKGSENRTPKNDTFFSRGVRDGRVATVTPMPCPHREKLSPATNVYHHPSSTSPLQSRFTILDIASTNTSMAKSLSSSFPEVIRDASGLEEIERSLAHHTVAEPTTGEKLASKVLLHTRGREQNLPLPLRLNEEELIRQRTQTPRLTTLSESFSHYDSLVDDPYGIPFHCMNCKGRIMVV